MAVGMTTGLAGCGPRWGIDPAVAASVVPVGLPVARDGSIGLADWQLIEATPPALVERDSRALQRTVKEIRSSLRLRAPEGTVWAGDCEWTGSDGGILLEGQWSIECLFTAGEGRHRLLLSSIGGDSLFDGHEIIGSIGNLEGKVGSHDSLWGRGTIRAMTFYRERREPGFDPRLFGPVAAVSVAKPEALYLVSGLDAALRVDVMLLAGTLVGLRSVTSFPARP